MLLLVELNKYKLFIIYIHGLFESIKLHVWDFVALEIRDLFLDSQRFKHQIV